ncbi:hypothetical protein, partial [Enterobacter intestinihominis]
GRVALCVVPTECGVLLVRVLLLLLFVLFGVLIWLSWLGLGGGLGLLKVGAAAQETGLCR